MPNRGGTHEQQVKAGQQSHKNEDNRTRQGKDAKNREEGGQRGGSGNFAENPERASEAGRKGGRH